MLLKQIFIFKNRLGIELQQKIGDRMNALGCEGENYFARVLFKQELNEGLGENKIRIWLNHTLWIPDHHKNNFF